jgi:MFS family permease
MNKSKIWTKDFIIVALINFFVAINFYLLLITISDFAMTKFAVSSGEAGFAVGIFVFSALVARLVAGKLIGTVGQKKILYTGLIIGCITSLLYFAADNIVSLIVIRFLNGAAFGIASTATGTIVAHIIPRDRCGESIAYYGLSVTLAIALGPFMGMFIIQHASYNVIFTVCTVFSALGFILSFFLSAHDIKLSDEMLKEMKGFKFSNLFEVKVIPISLVCMCIFFCYSSVASFLNVYSQEINLVEAGTFFYIVFASVIFFSRPFIGRMFDAKGENIIMYMAIIILMLGILLFSQANNGFTLLLAGAIIGLGFGAVQSSGQAIVVRSAEPHRIGLATSTFFMMADMGMGAGSLIFGLIIASTGYREMYEIVAIVLAFCILLYYLLHSKRAAYKKA